MMGLFKLCYACLDTSNKDLIDVSKMDFDNISFLYKLRACVSPDLEETSSKQICMTCVKQLRLSYKFREMVLSSQETLDKHKNEIISGTYASKSNKADVNRQLVMPEYIIVKHELEANAIRCRNAKDILKEAEEQPLAEVAVNNETEGDRGYHFLVDITDDSKNEISNTEQVNNNVDNYIIEEDEEEEEEAKLDEDGSETLVMVLQDPNLEYSSCEACDSSDAKEDSKNSSKEVLKRRRGPKKKMKNPKPEAQYECYHCSMVFNKRWKLQKHISRIHSDSKKYVCTYCNKGFKQSYHLREHLTSHTGERNYQCSYCEKSFQRLSSLSRHMRSHEAAPGQKTKRTPFLCTVCGKSFPFSNGVQRHMRIHMGIKNHECNVCLRRFAQSTHLHVHMRTHTGEKPYICDTCGEAFSLNASLQKHMGVHQTVDRKSLVVCKN